MKKKLSIPALLAAFFSGAVLTGILIAHLFVLEMGGYELLPRVFKFAAALSVIENEYVGDLDGAALDSAVYDSMILSLGDRWSYYLTADEYDLYREYSENQYTGIGVTISREEENADLLIVSVAAGSPAQKAGIKAGDILASIDGTDVHGMEIFEVRELIQSKTGQDITLTVQTADGGRTDILIRSEIIFKNPVSYELISEDIGYISILNFEAGCAAEVTAAIGVLSGDGVKYFIFNVRGNPGGRLSELLEVLDFLLPEGEVFVSRDKYGSETVEKSGPECFEAPMAVLIDSDSYSAAEFFAAVLSEYDWAKIIGERSTGKARAQQTFEFSDGSAVHISTSAYLTPNRVDLSAAGGVVPDIEVDASPGSDNQLQAAIDYLKGDRP